MAVESYATLLNLKLIVPSTKSNYVAVDRNYFTHSFGLRIAQIDLDETWYQKMYPDVGNAVRTGVLTSVQQHYCESGYFEHRLPYRIKVDDAWYLDQYEDVGAAIAKKAFNSAQEHFEEVGFKEGRHPYPGFSLRSRSEQVVERVSK